MESRASSRVTLVALPSFCSTFQPLNQGICGDGDAEQREVSLGRGYLGSHPRTRTRTRASCPPARPPADPACTHVGAGLQHVAVPALDGHKDR